jgi:hypothetical protein
VSMIICSTPSNGVTSIRVLLLYVWLYLTVELISGNDEARCIIHHHIEAVTFDLINSLKTFYPLLCLINERYQKQFLDC